MKKFEYPWKHDENKTVIPDGDWAWDHLIKVREYFWMLQEVIEKQQEKLEVQDIEIDKLKRHVSNRVQKIEIVKFCGETDVPKQPWRKKD